jgi:hypothetical protein
MMTNDFRVSMASVIRRRGKLIFEVGVALLLVFLLARKNSRSEDPQVSILLTFKLIFSKRNCNFSACMLSEREISYVL